ncbi:uncharacterized protein LOC120849257 [Ixodes scapularis]|uniref:uncharacterized protein LOC120849257 n=1 Tax=Ixodes scapularis TaxID=6945 RepID=UPI001A9FE749|nr:uncharacterized protein LOC120849257 [Ixodes scapularis]
MTPRSSGKQPCDAERYWGCSKWAMNQISFPDGKEEQRLAKDCKVSKSVDSCTKYTEIGGCSDDLKQRFQYLKSDFASLRSHLCDPHLHTSILEWNQCLNKSASQSCLELLPQDLCSTGRYNCFLNATTKCTRDSPAMKAMHDSFNIHLDLKNCSRIDGNDGNGGITTPLDLKNCSSIDCNDGNGGITTSPKILLKWVALCISLFPLRK